MEQRSAALHHSYTDVIPTAVIGRVLEKPEPGRSCPVTRSPSPQASEFPDKVQRHTAYKSSDLYCSDTALYCPTDERRRDRWLERQQSVDQSGRIRGHTDDNLDDESFSLHEDPFRRFVLGSLPASSCSTVSDEKLHGCTDWHGGDYECNNLFSYGKEHPGFPKSSSLQHVGSQNGRSWRQTHPCPCGPNGRLAADEHGGRQQTLALWFLRAPLQDQTGSSLRQLPGWRQYLPQTRTAIPCVGRIESCAEPKEESECTEGQ